MSTPLFFAAADLFHAWLAAHHASERELLVGYHKVASGLPSMTWPQSVYEARNPARAGAYSFEQAAPAEFDAAEVAALQQHANAWPFFQSLPTGYRRTVTHWISSAKKPETRARRFAQLLHACIDGRRLT